MTNKEYETVDERQSYVQKSGEEWENKAMDFVNQQLKKLGSDYSRMNIDKVCCHAA